MSRASFIGLGVMGYPMAGHISKAGHDVTVFNRTTTKAEKWTKEYKGKFAKSPMEAVKDSDFIFSCVGNDNDLKEVTLGDNGLFKSAKKILFISNAPRPSEKDKEFLRKLKMEE